MMFTRAWRMVPIVAVSAALLVSQSPKREQPGEQSPGSYLLTTGWKVSPAGKTIDVSTLPMSTALSADGRYMAVLNGGFAPPSVSVIDLETGSEAQRVRVLDGWRGTAFSATGRLYAGGGARPLVTEFRFENGRLSEERQILLYPGESPAGAHLIADVVTLPMNKLLVADMFAAKVLLMDAATGTVEKTLNVAASPYAVLAGPDGKKMFVSSWGDARVHEYDLADGKEVGSLDAGPYPTEMALARDGRMFVAAANTNEVAVAARRQGNWRMVERINLSLSPKQPVGVTPSALSLSGDGKTLYVACSHTNSVAVVDVSGERSSVVGFIPTGWYPTAVRPIAGNRLAVINGKGLSSYPNPKGPNPTQWPRQPGKAAPVEYVGNLHRGAIQIVPPFDAQQLAAWTRTVVSNSPFRDELLSSAGVPAGNPVPDRPGQPSPIKHVILLMKENRTYDQVFGDMKGSNADPSLLLFGEKVTPNHHKLARDFVLLDNFYVNADVSSDGMWWTTAAIAPDHNQKTWPMGYARRLMVRPPASAQPAVPGAPGGHLWNKALNAGLSFYNYGFFAVNVPGPAPAVGQRQIAEVRDPALRPHTNLAFRQHDRTYSDVLRMQVFLKDLAEWENSGKMPQLVMMTIGNDHTDGTTPGHPTPFACVADNDQAVGVMVEALTRSRFWKDTALFILEDDAQDGPDHVDSHRSIAFVISPYTKRGALDSNMYSTTSMLRTIELILGLTPMTTFDAAARPMWTVFTSKPDLTPYKREEARVSTTELNPPRSATAARSRALNFNGSDEADDDELNEILYLAIRGKLPPAPVRSAFVR